MDIFQRRSKVRKTLLQQILWFVQTATGRAGGTRLMNLSYFLFADA
jgi:hypothetical protein